MAQLNVDLLPSDLLQSNKVPGLTIANKISIVVLAAVILVSVATFYLRVSQSEQIKQAQNQLSQAENDLSQYKDTESNLVIIKQQLTTISGILNTDANRKELFFNLVTNLPKDVNINTIDIDKNNNLTVGIVSNSLDSVNNFFYTFIQDDRRLKQIKKVDLGSLSVGADGKYRVTLKIVGT